MRDSVDHPRPRSARADCEFLESIRSKQRKFWSALLFWWVCAIAFVIITTQAFKGVPNVVVMLGFYGSAFLLYLPTYALYRVSCPYCHRAAGALPMLRYKFLICRSCGERIECNESESGEKKRDRHAREPRCRRAVAVEGYVSVPAGAVLVVPRYVV